ncbi:MAG TPA: DNA polymerase III subunit gamma/tau, partial [Dehalococcoidales bacterium]|nr:DNA polymerase III subunit gamma/tau [Dehalococcoidales bacterium]
LERLRTNWKQLIEEAPATLKKSNAIALLRSGSIRPIAIDNDTIVLSFQYPIHRDTMQKPENQREAEKFISDFLGRACKIRCICEAENNHLTKAAIKLGAQITSVEEK